MGKNLSAFFKKTYTLIQIFLFLNVSFFTYAQESSIFETVTENEGLPSNYIFQVVQDENDIIWAGTDKGLTKFENGKWNTFTTDDGLPGNYVNKLLSDQNGGLLLYFSENGLYYFDISKNKILMQLKQISPKSEIHMAHADLNKNFIVISDNYKDKITYYLFETNKKQFYYGRKTSGFITLNGKKISRDIVLKPKNEIVQLNYDAIYVHNAEACGGGFIFWKNNKWNWLQQE